MKEWLRNAFAVDPPGPAEPTPEQAAAVDAVCRFIVRRRMTTPALLALETCRPLNYVTSQAMHFLRPAVSAVLDPARFVHFAEFLEQRGSVDHLCLRLEALRDAPPASTPKPDASASPKSP